MTRARAGEVRFGFAGGSAACEFPEERLLQNGLSRRQRPGSAKARGKTEVSVATFFLIWACRPSRSRCPKTVEGRKHVAEAQRRRWSRLSAKAADCSSE